MLKPFFPQLQTTFLKALNDVNRSVRLKAGSALRYLIVIHMRPDPLFNELFNGIKGAEDSSVRDTYLQALRGCVEPSGDRMSAPVLRQALQLLLGMIAHQEDGSRSAGAGCLGALCRWLPEDDLTNVINDHLFVDNTSTDWTIRHGRSTALFVALKACPERICPDDNALSRLEKTVISLLAADRVPVAENGVRCACFLFDYRIRSGLALPAALVSPYCKTINHSSNDVKLLVAITAGYLGRSSSSVLPKDLLRLLLPALVNGTKEKNSAVRASSESALVSALHMRRGEVVSRATLAAALSALDSAGAKEALQDVVTKTLQKVATQPEGNEEAIDKTILT